MTSHGEEDSSEEVMAQKFEAPHQTVPVPHMPTHLSNSLTTTANGAAVAPSSSVSSGSAVVSHSVVPDLMRVYESMTQSKTPHQPQLNGVEPAQQLQPQPQQDSSIYYQPPPSIPQSWSFDSANTTSIPIPAPYQMPPPQSHDQPQKQGRSLRKRSAPKESGYASSSSSGGGGGSKRRKSKKGDSTDDGKGKDGKANDGRWSKRFSWPEDLHRDFVSAIFDVGLKHSSPSSVLEHMPPHEQITTERIKSHLQKYRVHRQKSKKEFMTSYAATLQKLNAEGTQNTTSLAGGQVAGYLTYATRTQPDPELDPSVENQDGTMPPPQQVPQNQRRQSQEGQSQQHEDMLVLPRLTEAEKKSLVGVSLGYLLGLFFSLKQQLEHQREQQRQEAAAAAAAAHKQQQEQHAAVTVYDSFLSEPPQAHHHLHSQEGQFPASAAAAPVPPSTRSNLEENSMMKREMQNQMAFQNKMRALKQQELNKYKMAGVPNTSNTPHGQMHHAEKAAASAAVPGDSTPGEQAEMQQQVFQGTGEAIGADAGRERGQSIALDDDEFWNTDVVDEQLFEFLLNS